MWFKTCNLRQKTYNLRQTPRFGEFFLYNLIGCLHIKPSVFRAIISKGDAKMDEKKYTTDDFLIVSENYTCPSWEKDTRPCRFGWTRACFFCKYADFRAEASIRRAEGLPRDKKLYSVCHNEKNKKSASDTRGNSHDCKGNHVN